MRLLAGSLSAALLFACCADATFACSSCGCTLNTDLGSQGPVSGEGWRLDLRYDLVDQDQLRSGGSAAAMPALPTAEEIEQETRNSYTTLGIDYGFSREWGLDLQLPWLTRHHTTFAEGDTALSTSDSDSPSDIKLMGRYAGFTPDLSWGLLFGLKLPTGSRDVKFRSGPAAGEALDRSLQPGTGTTDALLGVYHYDDFGPNTGWFGQVLYQHALDERDGYRAGDSLNLNAGLRYYWNDSVTPQLQLNLQARGHDTDRDPAGHANSGGRLAYISPGFTFALSARWHGHSFLQFPLYQYVYGLQLAPTRVLSLGLSYTFR